MKKTVFFLILASSALVAQAREVNIEVYGMTCTFCVDSLQRTFKAMPDVTGVQVSLQKKQVHLQTQENAPSVETIRQAVLDAGFTPEKITVLSARKEAAQ